MSAKATDDEFDFAAVMGKPGGGGIPHGERLIAFVEAALGADDAGLDAARVQLRDAVGDAGLVDAAAVIANYSALDRVADATGIPLEPAKEVNSADIRATLGIDAFA